MYRNQQACNNRFSKFNACKRIEELERHDSINWQMPEPHVRAKNQEGEVLIARGRNVR